MKNIIYRTILIISIASVLALTNYSKELVLLTCLGVIMTSLNYIFSNKKGTSIIYLFLSLILIAFFPQAIFFLPLFSYDIARRENYYIPLFIYIIALSVSLISLEYKVLVFGISIISIYVRYVELSLSKKENEYEDLLNDSSLVKVKLKEKNYELLDSKSNDIYIATLDERARIARAIHDGVGHLLSSSIIQLGAIKHVNKDENLTPLLEQLDSSLNVAMDEMRVSVHNEHSDSINLEYELNNIINNYSFCKVYLSYEIEHSLKSNSKYTITNIIKEALNNTLKHSNASYIKISLKEFKSFIQLIIYDNGSIDKEKGFGLGLTSINEQIDNLKGTTTITNTDGFKIHITISKENI